MNTGQILKIQGKTPLTELPIDIQLDGKSLILTGKNGAGKTSFLKNIERTLGIQIKQKKDNIAITQIRNHIKRYQELLNSCTRGSSDYQNNERQLQHFQKQLTQFELPTNIEYNNQTLFSASIDDFTGSIYFFEASRQTQITQANSATPIDLESQRQQLVGITSSGEKKLGNRLEQYLVDIYVQQSFARQENPEFANQIQNWLNNFNDNLKFLMEDESAKLDFTSKSLKIMIHQDSKEKYSFQTLSSGFSAIFNIYFELLMRISHLNITPDQLTGVAIIDEIDAHLHLSLQRKILPFLQKSFPKIQFIVSTHSPFVLSSVDDFVIYDISKREQVEDLSFYSYSAIVEGLFGVSVSSDILIEKIQRLSQITNTQIVTPELIELVRELMLAYDHLDDESQFFVNQAQILILKHKKQGDQHV